METLLDLTEPWLYVLVFLLAAAEGAALVGLVLPGETSMLIAGVVVYQGNADGPLVYGCGIVGAVVGDSLGYWIGRRFGPRIRSSRLGRKVGEERWHRAESYLRERGGRAVFFGRFAGFLRTLVPPVAGQARMHYGRFIAFNAPAAALWAAIFISLGFAGGGSWHSVERWAGRASAFVAILIGALVVSALAARWLLGHRSTAMRLWERTIASGPIRLVRDRFSRQLAFLRRRFDTAERFGLFFSLATLIAVATGIGLGELLDALHEGDELGRLDRSIAEFTEAHRNESMDAATSAIAAWMNASSAAIAAGAGAVVAAVVSRNSRWVVEGAAAIAGALLLDQLVRRFMELLGLRSPGEFPSGDILAVVVVVGLAVHIAGRFHGWRTAVVIGAVGVVVAVAMGVVAIYRGEATSSVLGGLLLGVIWFGITAAAVAAYSDVPLREDDARIV